MNKIILSDVVVSRGYNDNPAVRYSEKGEAAFFSIGKSVYDKNAENNRRYINFDVKAFADVCERIKKMNIEAGSYLHISGRLDEESWEDKDTKKNRKKTVIILEDLEYTYSGNKDNQNGNGNAGGNSGQNGYGNNSYGGGQNGYNNPGLGAAPPQYQQQYSQQPLPQHQQLPQQQQMAQQAGQMPQNFTGYETFGGNAPGGNAFYPQD